MTGCAVCGLPESQHAAAFGITSGGLSGTINNCAKVNGDPPSTCQICQGRCWPRHNYASSSRPSPTNTLSVRLNRVKK